MFCLAKEGLVVGKQEDIKPLLSVLHQTDLQSLYQINTARDDFELIIQAKFPALFMPLGTTQTIHSLLQSGIKFINQAMQQLKLNLLDYKAPSVTNLLFLYRRVHESFKDQLLNQANVFLSQAQRQIIIEEIADVYLGYMYDLNVKRRIIAEMVKEVFNLDGSMLDSQIISEYITEQGREYGLSKEQCFFGRAAIKRSELESNDESNQINKFVYTSCTVRFLEQITMAIQVDEPLLLVGETGTGKTTVVQEVAKILGKKLHVFNMNQNTDSADLLGGFKPVDLKYLLTPIYGRFRELFMLLLNSSTPNNKTYLDLLQKCYESNKVNDFIKCLQHGMKSIRTKQSDSSATQIQSLDQSIQDLNKRAQKLESGGGFVFQFVEGTLIKSIQNGDWILLDEINLAPDSVLNKLSTIILGSNILLNERADIVETKRHKDFRIFMCMNPPYTSAGKKQLPISLRSRLCELYAAELENQDDLWQIIDRNTKQNASLQTNNMISESHKRQILEFYIQVKAYISKQTRRGNIGLRNLCRALFFIKSAVSLNYPVIKAIYDSLHTCFASHLDEQLQAYVKDFIIKLFNIKSLPTLQQSGTIKEGYTCIQDCIVRLGGFQPENFDPNNFILTNTFKQLLRQLASVVSVSNFAIILEGPTSAGKTSCVQYLAAVTHNKVIRINNHMHTDVQEYLGSYVPDSITGKLTFQEGVLVEAVRKGYWVILDELNLAPSEVLEALNRLLDDNRELHIVETQKVIKAHPNFRIFATQNPTEGYGGRKELSEAFKNRFVLIRVRDVPIDELQEILVKKCSLPPSRASLMVKVMENLQIFRSQSNLFSGKNSIITVRDLLKWAGRINQNNDQGGHVTPESIALEGFLLLAERSRNSADKEFIKTTIEKVFAVVIDAEKFYHDYFDQQLKNVFERVPSELNLPKIIPSRQFVRLAVLVAKCLKNKEPVLLVGETGCGKTTLCQVFASEVTKQALFSINCHQNTETSDFIGCMRTRKNLQKTQDELQAIVASHAQIVKDDHFLSYSLKKQSQMVINALKASNPEGGQVQEIKRLLDDLSCVFEWHDGILVESMQQGGLLLIDEISLANDSVLERLNSVFEEGRTLILTEKSSQEAVKIQAAAGFNMVATMNPSGDFGKKELSPALRNRMTEIWVESYFQQKELTDMFTTNANQVERTHMCPEMSTNLFYYARPPKQIDLNLIIEQLCGELPQEVACGIFNMVCYVTFILAEKYFALQRKAMSIRDILNMIDFIRASNLPVAQAFTNAVELVIIDGVCLGIDVAGNQESNAILHDCNIFLDSLTSTLFKSQHKIKEERFINTKTQIGVESFLLTKLANNETKVQFAFEASTTKSNLKKLLRAFSLGKPILIEGPPGVGKTALVENLAKESGHTLVRVNLSEQTDMMDLLGSEYPVSSSNAQDDDEIQFRWSDGVLLQAIKEGHWLLIDEMNLAQQSILEGLNAILDHRRTVYIPELNKEFVCHPNFFVFACQNPSQSSGQTSGRKTLPKSFLNRFIKIFLDELTPKDYELILTHTAKDLFPTREAVASLLYATKEIELINQVNNRHQVSATQVNMRDLSRFLRLLRHYNSETTSSAANLVQALETCYFMRQSAISQTSIQIALKSKLISEDESLRIKTPVVRVQPNSTLLFAGIRRTCVQKIKKQLDQTQEETFNKFIELKGKHALKLQGLVDCLQSNIPILITTDDPPRLIRAITMLAQASGHKTARILLNEKSDTTQLLGCFEQTSSDLSAILRQLETFKDDPQLIQALVQLEAQLHLQPTDADKLKLIEKLVISNAEQFGECFLTLGQKIKAFKKGASRFEWIDSVLVSMIDKGGWAIFENANLCNPSILDRLNSLLEEGNQSLSINEQGLVAGEKLRTVHAHQDFRSIFIMTERTLNEQGKDVSRALRNRCQEFLIKFDQEEPCQLNDSLVTNQVLREGSKEWQMNHLQADHDITALYNCIENQEVQAQFTQVPTLGKRERNQMFTAQEQQSTAVSLDSAIANLFLLISFLQDLKQDSELQKQKIIQIAVGDHQSMELLRSMVVNQEGSNGLESFICYLIQKSQTKLKECIQTQVIDSNMLPILKEFCKKDFSNNKMFFVLLQELLSSQIRQSFTEPQVLHLVSHIQLTDEHKKLLLSCFDDDLAFLISKDSLSSLRYLKQIQANCLNPSQIQECISQQEFKNSVLDEQSLYIYKVAKEQLNSHRHTSRVSLSLAQLSAASTVILFDKDKEIMKEQHMIEQLEAIPDQAQILETPNLIIVPIDVNNQQIVMSQSYIYESLCTIKDFISLNKDKPSFTNIRLTNLPVVLSHFKTQNAKLYSTVAKKIAQDQLMAANVNEGTNFAVQTISAILQDEKTICLRDLPAYFACATSLLYKLKHQQLTSDKLNQDLCLEFNLMFDSLVKDIPLSKLSCLRQKITVLAGSQEHQALAAIAVEAVEKIDKALALVSNLHTLETIQAMFILPLETERLTKLADIASQEVQISTNFFNFHIRDSNEAKLLVKDIEANHLNLKDQVNQLQELQTTKDNGLQSKTQRLLKPLLSFTSNILSEIENIVNLLQQFAEDSNQLVRVANACNTLGQLLGKGLEVFYPLFNNILMGLFAAASVLEENVRLFCLMCSKIEQTSINLAVGLINLKSTEVVAVADILCKTAKKSQDKGLYEKQLLFAIRFNRHFVGNQQSVVSQAFDYFVRREVVKKMKAEEVDPDQQIFFVPFKVRDQIPPVVGKAMDEWTKEDVAKMEAEAEKEIERQFPSYYDEVQQTFFASEFTRDGQRLSGKEKHEMLQRGVGEVDIPLDEVFTEILEVQELEAQSSKGQLLQDKLEIAQMALDLDTVEQTKRSLRFNSFTDPMRRLGENPIWQEDACGFLQHQLDQTIKLKQIMNVTDVNLSKTFNFYHSPLPEELKLVLQPLQNLLMRLRDIVIRDEYESPLLNESMFLANYMITCFNAEQTPLMKILMSIEFLLTKLEEWENTYASKRLNSVENEINMLKQLVIRFRKIQILSWRNLLNWKKQQFVKEDFLNYVRLAHTLERQIFDSKMYKKQKAEEQSVEIKMFELLDLFMRDSTLGLFSGRLKFMKFLLAHFEYKQQTSYLSFGKSNPKTEKAKFRLIKLVNALTFVSNYYDQFQNKLDLTVQRLDSNAREKVKTLIDVRKWTVQKFSIIKNNIDKTHRQLYRACKDEEEALMQNVQALVIASSRKKYAGNNDQLLSLDPELKVETFVAKPLQQLPSDLFAEFQFLKSLAFLEETRIRNVWPSSMGLESAMNGFFERLADVRAVNKKHIQKRAFYDLLRFFKNQGVRSTLSDIIQPLLIESKIRQIDSAPNYFYKAFETHIMMAASSQVDDKSDLKNAEIRRVQGFSQNLVFKILTFNQSIEQIRQLYEKLKSCLPASILRVQENPVFLVLNKNTLKQSDKLKSETQVMLGQLLEKLKLQRLVSDSQSVSMIDGLSSKVHILKAAIPDSPFEANFDSRLKSVLVDFDQAVNEIVYQLSERSKYICNEALTQSQSIQTRFSSLIFDQEDNQGLAKSIATVEKYVKVVYQDIVKALVKADEKIDVGTRKSSLEETTNPTVFDNEESDITMEQQLDFTAKIAKVLEKLPKLTETAIQVFEIQDKDATVSGASLRYTYAILKQLCSCLDLIIDKQTQMLQQMSKFSYVTQRVFLYLIYQGFCGIEEPDDPDEQPPSDLEQEDGQGLGDGQGGAQNITDQIEHEEQLEGLKNYESEEEEKQENQDQGNDDEEDNDFEMKNDFDGDMDSERDEEKKHDEKDEEDEKDNVDDLLDNQLWDQNMEDMEKKEQEEQEKDKDEENREIDLGERDIAPQNQVDNKEQDVAEGDFNNKEYDSGQEDKDKPEDQEMPDAESEGGERHESEAERDEESEQEDIPLDKDSMKAEPEEEFSDEGEDVSELQSDADKVDESEEQEIEDGIEQDQGEEDSEKASNDDELDVKQDCNQAVLEDDQIQAKEDKDKKEQQANTQANLKKQEQANKDQSQKQQDKPQDTQSASQVDLQGRDMLYQLTQQLQQRQKQKEQEQKQNQNKQEAPRTIDDPTLNEKQPEAQDEPMADDGEAMEYELDQNAQQMQGRLCTDQAEDQAQMEDQQMEDQESQNNLNEKQEQEPNENAEMTGAVVKQADMPKADTTRKATEHDQVEEESKEQLQDVIGDYLQYLAKKQDMLMEVDHEVQIQTNQNVGFTQVLEPFDLLTQKQKIREMFQDWAMNKDLHRQSLELLAKFKNQTQQVSASLCEQLRIVLEPQLSQNLQGDFKTGKRLNMKKVISFIASHYRNDKIWLRRTLPSKRDYKILIAIDDTLSMKENNLGFFSLEAMVALTEALNRLEVGKVAVARIRDRMDLLHGFDDSYTAERAGFIVSQFQFAHCAKTSADHAMANFVCDANKLLDMQNHSVNSVNTPFVIVLSDGRFNKDNVRRYIREAKEKRYLFIFIVLDKVKTLESGKQESGIMSLRSAVKNEQGSIKLVPYLKDFPFDYYCICQDTQQLPNSLGTILVQWFSMIAGGQR